MLPNSKPVLLLVVLLEGYFLLSVLFSVHNNESVIDVLVVVDALHSVGVLPRFLVRGHHSDPFELLVYPLVVVVLVLQIL